MTEPMPGVAERFSGIFEQWPQTATPALLGHLVQIPGELGAAQDASDSGVGHHTGGVGGGVVCEPDAHLARDQAEELALGPGRQWQRLVGRAVCEPAQLSGLQLRARTQEAPQVLAAAEVPDHARVLDDGAEDLRGVVHVGGHVDAAADRRAHDHADAPAVVPDVQAAHAAGVVHARRLAAGPLRGLALAGAVAEEVAGVHRGLRELPPPVRVVELLPLVVVHLGRRRGWLHAREVHPGGLRVQPGPAVRGLALPDLLLVDGEVHYLAVLGLVGLLLLSSWGLLLLAGLNERPVAVQLLGQARYVAQPERHHVHVDARKLREGHMRR
mmetsp:Transcript_104608/g.296022  ORF Transcript_104608/g.296022 Transcript_104608/m.296022 type:complete len:327 (+) Transcript_104608:94-1074(+)